MLRAATANSRQLSVGIIGAGFAGLRCADVLLHHGFKVTILEARNRLGGRVAQSSHLGHLVDLGPNWIHGTDNNPIMTIAQETGTQLQIWSEGSWMYNCHGELLSQIDNESYDGAFWSIIADAFRYSKAHHHSINPNISLLDFFSERAAEMWTEKPSDDARNKREMLLTFASMWSLYIGSPVTRQSLKYFWLEECIDGENLFVTETYQKILDAVAGPAQRGADIHLNTEVTKIVTPEAGAPTVRTAQGSELLFDEVIVTVPLGWLKDNKGAFEPPLPARLSVAIDNISYGTLDKVYITFPHAFWSTRRSEGESKSTGAIDSHHTTPNTTASIAPVHPTPSNVESDHVPGLIHWLEPHYAPESNSQKWFQEGMNLAALPPSCAHPTLLFYIQGPQSKHIGDIVSSSRSDDERDTKLRTFFEPYYSRLPNYDRSNPACTPRAFLATAWVNDKFAGYGSYTNFQVGLEKGDEDMETMRHGMPDRHVWMAGEHTAPFIACGTSTGAYWSGEAVAQRIVEAHGLGK